MSWDELVRILLIQVMVMLAHWGYIRHLQHRVKALEKHNQILWDRNWTIIEAIERAIKKEWHKWEEKV